MSKKLHQNLFDYLTIAISPALIMTLVGSLVFFLMEVFYVGENGVRMRWILFCFVFGAVLIARVSMLQEIADRATLYGFVLGGLVWMSLSTYVDSSPSFNLFLVVVILWSTKRLAWDCTHIDDNIDASGAGLLQTVGLEHGSGVRGQESGVRSQGAGVKKQESGVREQGSGSTEQGSVRDREPSDCSPSEGKKKGKAKEDGLLEWWFRLRRYREEKRRQPHTPGVWVVYFSLAALPIFGLGQSLIPSGDEARRRIVFWFMGIYVASGLGLLLTTSFLGLRRYLRQRQLEMPIAIVGIWLSLGSSLIAALLILGALLPRPHPEYPIMEVTRLLGKEQKHSRWAPNKKKSDEGTPISDKGKDKGDGKDGSDKNKGKEGNGADKDKGKNGSSSDKNKDKNGDKSPSNSETKKKEDQPADERKPAKDAGSGNAAKGFDILPKLQGVLAPIVKWIVYILLALAGLYILWRLFWGLLKELSNFTAWARRLVEALRAWWQGLFAGRQSADTAGGEVAKGAEQRPPLPFTAFRNPFSDAADQRSPEEMVRYTFEALQAFSQERGLPRRPDETPLEFADRLGQDIPALDQGVRRFAALYARVAYARGRLPATSLEPVKNFWQSLENAYHHPLSA